MEARVLAVMALLPLVVACSTGRKLSALKTSPQAASLSIVDDTRPMALKAEEASLRDTLKVTDDDGREVLIMKAVRDEDGEMVATDRIQAATVTALFKNVAERHGKVDLRFNITVPPGMTDSRWQLRLQPTLYMQSESSRLDPVIITGEMYRKAQLRGYQQYERFLNSIITDSTVFIRKHDLEVFLARNLPEVYAMRNDTTFVSDETFHSFFGVTGKEASDHYTYKILKFLNERRMASRDRKFRQFVKVPIETGGLRLDTIIRKDSGEFVYEYVQTVSTRPGLRKAQITLAGDIYEEDRRVYRVPESDTLTFYISAISTLVENTERYIDRIVERKVEANTVCWIDFKSGSAELDPSMGDNQNEMGRIRANISELLENTRFDLDSIVVTASASPEGTVASNSRLSQKRSAAVCGYYADYIRAWNDSLAMETGARLSIGETYRSDTQDVPQIVFIPRSIPENWNLLTKLIEQDSVLTTAEKEDYRRLQTEADPDRRERTLASRSYYRHLREVLYPQLRTVRFDFCLHRKGMTADTLHTTIADTVYRRGLQLISDREYKSALELLRPYADYNTAVAYASMDYNASALSILETLVQTPKVNYLLAIVYSRIGRERDAVERYLRACHEDPSLIHRGNLDPEISALIKNYSLEDQLYTINNN